MRLAKTAKYDGRQEYKNNLELYAHHNKLNSWNTIEETDRPHWAINNGDLL